LTEGVHLILSPSALPEGFGTSPFGPLRGQKGEARTEGSVEKPAIINAKARGKSFVS